MTLIAKLRDRIGGDRLTRNIGWYGLAEAIVRVSRLVTTILLARLLLPADFGIAAIALTASELIRVLASNGIGQTIIRAREDELAAVCATAQRAVRLIVKPASYEGIERLLLLQAIERLRIVIGVE